MNRTADKMLIICFVFAMAAGWHIPEAYAMTGLKPNPGITRWLMNPKRADHDGRNTG